MSFGRESRHRAGQRGALGGGGKVEGLQWPCRKEQSVSSGWILGCIRACRVHALLLMEALGMASLPAVNPVAFLSAYRPGKSQV